MPGEADDPHIVGEVFAAELGADPQLVRLVEELLLQLQIAERLAVFVSMGGKLVVILAEASFAAFRQASALVPPTTTAM
jgi:hypothetical protein